MSAEECLEHKWLNEISRPLQNGKITKIDTTSAVDITTQINKAFEQNGDLNKSNGIDITTSASSPPTKPSTGFFLHQNPKNRTTFLKQNTTTNNTNLNCNQIGPNNNTNELLKDFATNKENINLSKILANRITPLQNQSTTAHQLLNNLNKGSTTTPTTINNEENSVQQSLVMPSSNSSSSTNTSTSTTKHETILFPDAPTTPKVSRKSTIESDADTPSCVALVKQFQLSNGGNLSASASMTTTTTTTTTKTTNRIDFDEINVTEPVFTQSSINRNKFATTSNSTSYKDHGKDNLPTSYRLSATAITASTTPNGHHSITSSTLSINTLTDTTVGVQSDSTVTINCLCGVDKTGNNCCCNSRTALNYRKKSLAVVDNSILC